MVDRKFSNTARAPFWYCKDVLLKNIASESVKVFRECKNVEILDSIFNSDEPFRRNDGISVKNSKVSGFARSLNQTMSKSRILRFLANIHSNITITYESLTQNLTQKMLSGIARMLLSRTQQSKVNASIGAVRT